MNIEELRASTDLAISNLTISRFREIMKSADYKSESELVNAIRDYANKSHTKDEVQTKSERLLGALMFIVYQFEETEVINNG